ncbi:helix-turn-helix domain-containing protein [Enterococcus sp. LJL128]
MYAMAKRLITEKDIRRKITILEKLINHQQLTAKELAEELQVSERTVFNDLQSLRMELPEGWQLEADGNSGLSLVSDNLGTVNEVWEFFMKDSIGILIVKELLTVKEVPVQSFLNDKGLSYETLKRQVGKLNKALKSIHLQINLSQSAFEWVGEESSIRVFYHRLLVPFTHDSFFFEDYSIHERHYIDFLAKLDKTMLGISTEQIFGTCWFFINTIRIKAGCLIEEFRFNTEDILFTLYKEKLEHLYQLEGIRLKGKEQEHFYAFFCFLESWNYNALTDQMRETLKEAYESLFIGCEHFIQRFSSAFQQNKLSDSSLLDNLVLFLLKYYESKRLSDKFLLEYQEILLLSQERFPALYQAVYDEMKKQGLLERLPHSDYVVSVAALLVQEAIFSVAPRRITAYFIFQGEPAWKSFLLQELQDMIGSRVHVEALNTDELDVSQMKPADIILSNQPLKHNYSQQVIYISSVPTQNELQTIREAVQYLYL